tara:strand:- start:300 stop:482 length:183 start_codon:yes stop_codon:yes gene_type:complete
LEFEATEPPPPPQDIRIAQINITKCFIIHSQKYYKDIIKMKKKIQEKSLPKKAFFRINLF